MRVVCAGGGPRVYRDLCESYSVSRLFSILNEKTYIKRWQYPDRFLMIDSGAHSWNKFTITKIGHSGSGDLPHPLEHLAWYERFVFTNRFKNWVFVEFDVYGHLSKEAIDVSYKKVKSWGGNIEFIRVYHPIIDGGSLEVLKQWIDEGQDYIGIGNDSIPYLSRIFKMTQNKIKIHGFAMTKIELLKNFPFYSVDSTSPLSVAMYGTYNDGLLKRKAKSTMLRQKDYKVFLSNDHKIEVAIQSVKQTEKFLTELWSKRGVTWNDRYSN